MCPLAESDGHDAPRLIDEPIPREAAMVDDIVVGSEYAVGQPVVAHELPDVFDRIEFGAAGRERHQCYVGWNDQFGGSVSPGLVENDRRVRAGRDMECDLLKVYDHSLGVVARGHDPGGPCLLRQIAPNIHAWIGADPYGPTFFHSALWQNKRLMSALTRAATQPIDPKRQNCPNFDIRRCVCNGCPCQGHAAHPAVQA
jgi:hypothetical protein